MAKNELAVVEPSDYAIMKSDPAKLARIIEMNLGEGGDGLSEFDIQRIQMPSGKAPVFTIEGPSGTETPSVIDGIILYSGNRRAYWQAAYGSGEGGGPPDCSSMNALKGIGRLPGDSADQPPVERICKRCPMAQFGTAKDAEGKPAKGQACAHRRILFLALPDRKLPVAISLPPTSLKSYQKYAMGLVSEEKPITDVITRISLSKTKNSTGTDYAVAEFEMIRELTPDESNAMLAMAEGLMPLFQSVGIDDDDRPQGATVRGEVIDRD